MIKSMGMFEKPPVVPYRRISDSEKTGIHAYFGNHPKKDNEKFWRQTVDEGRKIVNQIREGGFVVGGELYFGGYPDSEGQTVSIYPRDFESRIDVSEMEDSSSVIGSVGLWEYWGFETNPVRVLYQNFNLIDDSIQLRDYLKTLEISFLDSVSPKGIRESNDKMAVKISRNNALLEKLKTLDLRS